MALFGLGKHEDKKKGIPLNSKAMPDLPVNIERPGYDRSKITTGIVHFGLGNFYRAHLCSYLNRLLEIPGHEKWGLTGVEVIECPASQQKDEAYAKQDNLYSLTRFNPDATHKTAVIGSICGHLYAPGKEDQVLNILSAPETKIVSMTITEGGYNIDGETKEFRLDNPKVQHDLKNPQKPKTVFGFVVEALDRRRKAALPAFTVMSCDNLLQNGKTAHKAFTSFARARDPELADWIEEHVRFPNSMVDRITPTLSDKRKADINLLTGLDDQVPVLSEAFTQWVLEDSFSNGCPDFKTVGVEMATKNISAYEQAKLRILNESHSILGISGMLLGIEYIDEVLQHKEIKQFLEDVLQQDVIPTLEVPPGAINLQDYVKQTLYRFSNAALQDTTARIASDSVSKAQVFWSATIKNALVGDERLPNPRESKRRAVFMCALLLEYLRGRRLNGDTYPLQEPALSPEQLEIAKSGKTEDDFSLPIFDSYRGYITPEFAEHVTAARYTIQDKGIFSAMEKP